MKRSRQVEVIDYVILKIRAKGLEELEDIGPNNRFGSQSSPRLFTVNWDLEELEDSGPHLSGPKQWKLTNPTMALF